MVMLGYIGYAILFFLAVTWVIGVRVQLNAGTHTILGALFFLVGAITLAAFGLNKLHSLWIIPVGFVISAFFVPIALNVPVISAPFRITANLFASVVRFGIPLEKITNARNAGMHETAEELLGSQSKDE